MADVLEVHSRPIRKRLAELQELLNTLKDVKLEQDGHGQPGKGRAVWLGPALWREIIRQLEAQILEIRQWERLLVASRQEVQEEKLFANELQRVLDKTKETGTSVAIALEMKIQQMEREAKERAQEWEKHKAELQAQADDLLQLLKDRESLTTTNKSLHDQVRESTAAQVAAEARAKEAADKARELEDRLQYVMAKAGIDVTLKDELLAQIRRLEVALTEAQSQRDLLRAQLASRQYPNEELVYEAKRLRADNMRLVALLSDTREWKALSAEMASSLGLHYIPVEELLVTKGLTEDQYPALRDRPVQYTLVSAGAGSKKRRKGKKRVGKLAEVSVALRAVKGAAALGDEGEEQGREDADAFEEWHWVPRQAIDATRQAVARAMPAAPRQPLMQLLLDLNKIWRQREADHVASLKARHAQEVRQLHSLYRQRAPYEAVVGKTRLSELKRQLRLQVAHAQHLAAQAEMGQVEHLDNAKISLQLGLESVTNMSKDLANISKKNKALSKSLKEHQKQPPVCATCLDNMLYKAQQHGRAIAAASAYAGAGVAATAAKHDGGESAAAAAAVGRPSGRAEVGFAPAPPATKGVVGAPVWERTFRESVVEPTLAAAFGARRSGGGGGTGAAGAAGSEGGEQPGPGAWSGGGAAAGQGGQDGPAQGGGRPGVGLQEARGSSAIAAARQALSAAMGRVQAHTAGGPAAAARLAAASSDATAAAGLRAGAGGSGTAAGAGAGAGWGAAATAATATGHADAAARRTDILLAIPTPDVPATDTAAGQHPGRGPQGHGGGLWAGEQRQEQGMGAGAGAGLGTSQAGGNLVQSVDHALLSGYTSVAVGGGAGDGALDALPARPSLPASGRGDGVVPGATTSHYAGQAARPLTASTYAGPGASRQGTGNGRQEGARSWAEDALRALQGLGRAG